MLAVLSKGALGRSKAVRSGDGLRGAQAASRCSFLHARALATRCHSCVSAIAPLAHTLPPAAQAPSVGVGRADVLPSLLSNPVSAVLSCLSLEPTACLKASPQE